MLFYFSLLMSYPSSLAWLLCNDYGQLHDLITFFKSILAVDSCSVMYYDLIVMLLIYLQHSEIDTIDFYLEIISLDGVDASVLNTYIDHLISHDSFYRDNLSGFLSAVAITTHSNIVL